MEIHELPTELFLLRQVDIHLVNHFVCHYAVISGCSPLRWPHLLWHNLVKFSLTMLRLLSLYCVEHYNDLTYNSYSVGRVAQSVQRLAVGWTVRGSNPGRGEFFRTLPDRSWGPPSLLYNGYRLFPGGRKWPGRDADPSPPSSAVVMEG